MEINIIALAISIFMGIVVYSMMSFGRISHHNPLGVMITTVIIIFNYWFISSAGLFDNILPGPLDSALSGEDDLEGYVDIGENFTSTCIDNYIYKGYDEQSAEKLCKVKLRNIKGVS